MAEASLLSLNDVCCLFDIASLNEDYLESNNLTVRNGSLSALRSVFANLAVGGVPRK